VSFKVIVVAIILLGIFPSPVPVSSVSTTVKSSVILVEGGELAIFQ
jgi:hypothetical protein